MRGGASVLGANLSEPAIGTGRKVPALKLLALPLPEAYLMRD
jgi:hypothetical protein